MRTRFIFRLALLNLLIAALMGLILRYAFVAELPWLIYRPFQHGHSHVAMLGWVYLGLLALLVHLFVPEEKQTRFYTLNATLTQVSVFGMLVAFPLQGYGAWSIAFTTAHGLLSYVFAWRFLKDLSADRSLAAKWARAALYFLVLSTLALWAMPFIILNGQQGKALYYAAIQFYLHFQFNGWFIFAGLALLFRWLGLQAVLLPSAPMRMCYLMLVVSCLLTYALAVTWSNPSVWLFMVNSTGVLLQFAALFYLLYALQKSRPVLRPHLSDWAGYLLIVAFSTFALKILIQTAVVVPFIATIAYTIRNFVVGFIHLILLGVMTPVLFGVAGKLKILRMESHLTRLGLFLFLLAFTCTEVLLFLQGTMIWAAVGFIPFYYELLFVASVFFFPAVLLILLSSAKSTTRFTNPQPPREG